MQIIKIKLVRIILILLLFTACVKEETLDPIDWDDWETYDYYSSETFSYNFSVQGENGIYIAGINGDIIVEASSSTDKINIHGEKIVGSDNQVDAEYYLQELDFDISQDGNWFYVESIFPDYSPERSYYIDYHIIVPAQFEVEISLISGWIQIAAIQNNIVIENEFGDIDLYDTYGNLDISLEWGDIHCTHEMWYNGNVDMNNTYGNIYLDIPETTSAKVYASSTLGNIYFDNLDFYDQIFSYYSFYGVLGFGDGVIRLNCVYEDIYLTGY